VHLASQDLILVSKYEKHLNVKNVAKTNHFMQNFLVEHKYNLPNDARKIISDVQ
jgi:hypothetical protein